MNLTALIATAHAAPAQNLDVVTMLAILVLSAFVGFEVISKVPNTLHTPLMSGTNASIVTTSRFCAGAACAVAISAVRFMSSPVTGWPRPWHRR
ncbi:MAG: proton-translocating transhydrogenase family protein [Solirubrobacterales bacterium]|nr:proton-translocating transhydrogenase family protein [Solirubrobacterales bacterium]